MKVERMASVPLITHDPYFSVWSGCDRLYEGDTSHWCGKAHRMYGYVSVDGKTSCFLGKNAVLPVIEQVELTVTATNTCYVFENEEIRLTVDFCSPLLLEDPVLVSRPCTYLSFQVEPKKAVAEVKVCYVLTADLVSEQADALCGGSYEAADFAYGVMGKAKQTPLGHSGDHVTMDWGNVYLASNDKRAKITYDKTGRELTACVFMDGGTNRTVLVAAYDDLQSINYFGESKRGYWTTKYGDILEAIGDSFAGYDGLMKRCRVFDEQLEARAEAVIGREYVFLCNASYRHAVSAHKLIADEHGELIFLSKENDSNGCIGTVDVSYPSVPLFLLYDTEYVKGMLRPIFRFAGCKAWEYDFAPHDVGRYPYATGQVYGLNEAFAKERFSNLQEDVFPFFYIFPKGEELYDLKYQMPVEECGNMLILMAVVCRLDGSAAFAKPHMEVLRTWTEYLLSYGADPGEQLCTDDFAGHLSHNVNLSAKAIMGIESYSLLLAQLGCQAEAGEYHEKAVKMAKYWELNAQNGGETKLAFDREDSWSLKYNLVWDLFFGSGLFSKEVFEREIECYLGKTNEYGVPLDSRKAYTKSDWILWCAAMSGDQDKRKALTAPVAHYLKNSGSRVPFSDWYDTETGRYCSFIARSVQGGIFMPMFLQEKGEKRS